MFVKWGVVSICWLKLAFTRVLKPYLLSKENHPKKIFDRCLLQQPSTLLTIAYIFQFWFSDDSFFTNLDNWIHIIITFFSNLFHLNPYQKYNFPFNLLIMLIDELVVNLNNNKWTQAKCSGTFTQQQQIRSMIHMFSFRHTVTMLQHKRQEIYTLYEQSVCTSNLDH